MDLVREILRAVGGLATFDRPVPVSIEGYESEEVSYHVQIMAERGLLEARSFGSNDGPDWRPMRLTWEGQDFLEAASSDTRWQKAKEVMVQVQGFSFDVLKQVLIDLAQKQASDLLR